MKTSDKPDLTQLNLWSSQEEFEWQDYKVAREYVRSLGLRDQSEWELFVQGGNLRDVHIPAEPEKVYKHRGWIDWDDWLGRSRPEPPGKPPPVSQLDPSEKGLWSHKEDSQWMDFSKARLKAREYGFEYKEEWKLLIEGKFTRRKSLPEGVPENPDRVYRFTGWKGWKDWLVAPDKQVEYTGFYPAREFVRSCRIPGKEAWRDFLENKASPVGEYHFILPLRPHLEYSDSGWKDWDDWLGNNIAFLDFTSSRKFVRTLKLKDRKMWSDFCHGRLPHKPRKSEKLYSFPDLAFRNDGWKGWEDWLGCQPENNTGTPESKITEVTIECKCGGRIKNCQQCDGKGYYTVHL